MESMSLGRLPGGSRFARLFAGLGAFAVLVACSSAPATPAPSSSGSTVSEGTAPATTDSSRPASSQSAPPGVATSLSGTISAGVESGCIVLTDDQDVVLANLIGLDEASAPIGSTVEVQGRFQPDLMTTCQQGEPFEVASVVVR